MKLSQLKIDPEFQSKIPPLQFEEEQQLEQNIIAEGRLLNPIITWNGYILDGHTRYRILKKHGFIKFEVEEKRTCERIAVEHGVGSATVRRAEKYSRGIDAAEEAVPGAQEEILTGHIKATDGTNSENGSQPPTPTM